MEFIDYSWLIIIRQVSKDEMSRDLGHMQPAWEKLQLQQIDGDEIWEFDCDAHLPHPLAGCSGFLLKRGGQVVNHLVISRSFI
ncbi:hypothetical protein ETAA8_57120 [Anatilimnocola aggregata]|uniref:Uncharacterized protein n=1 Tax=Anatilimnocola aggregata TaxID=2528021 RepID=A0A517YK19_9BACT|nr:hypothetical protein [Anatilimnocola aggregata]QDU30566.1 hypothetical protein ETAA8_57120 [Anatilimnocola aggregata]